MSLFLYLLRWLALAALLFGSGAASADTPITLSKTFDGAVNFTGTQVTIRAYPNSYNACTVYTSSRSATLTMPAGATVLSAQLYWAGSGNTADNTVTLQGNSVTATRKYSSTTVGGGINFFAGAADVTEIVKARGSNTYSFSGLSVSTGSPWCASQAVLGGFALLVIYNHPDEDERILNLYEGFRYMQNSEFTVTANNFGWPKPAVATKEKARVGYISWEGDETLLSDGEALIFQGKELSDSMNPAGNQFNSKSSVNRDYYSYGIDFDVFDTEVTQCLTCQPVVTTTYRAGQDLVMLNAEILVVPTLPVSDLSLTMTRGGSMQVGGRATYTMTVTNNGPYTDAGPITVTDTLPTGMSFVSGTGTNWTCTSSGQTVTCTYKASMGPNTNAAPLVITASVNQAGTMTNTATVAGTADSKSANNTATDTATATGTVSASQAYKFTTKACTPGQTVGSTDCPLATDMTGGATAKVYVTAVNGNTAIALSKTAETTVPMQFSLSCFDPASAAATPTPKVTGSFAGTTLPVCTSNGAVPAATSTTGWSSSVGMKFAANSASAAVTVAQSNLGYPDVGDVQLNLLTSGKIASSEKITAKPLRMAFRSITNAAGIANPGANTPDGAGFAKAGEDFNVEVIALLADGVTPAPNFGNEAIPPVLSFSHGTAAAASAPMADAGAVSVSGQTPKSGAITAKLSYSELGAISLEPRLGDYLGSGSVPGTSAVVGRFYPAYYTTTITAPLDCQAPMGCEDAVSPLSGAAYSGEPFGVEIKAFNASESGDQLKNFTGAWRKPVTLTAVKAPGGVAADRPLLATTSSATPGTAPSLTATPNYTLAETFSADKAADTAWSAPTAIYLRAESVEKIAGATNATETVSSKRPGTLTSEEDGLMIINGRLNVASAQGTSTQRTPLRLQAQYWSGSAWLNHSWADAETQPTVAIAPGSAKYTSCRRNLKRAGITAEPASTAMNVDNCNTGATGTVKAGATATITLSSKGSGTFVLAAPGAANAGSVLVQMDSPTWLPSTRGRVNFGSTRTPMIYLREVY